MLSTLCLSPNFKWFIFINKPYFGYENFSIKRKKTVDTDTIPKSNVVTPISLKKKDFVTALYMRTI